MSIGIDIGKHSTKIVELSLTKGEVSIKRIGSLNTFDDINKFDLEKISKSQLEACVQDLSKKMSISPRKMKQVISSVSGTLVDIRQISTLDMPDEELSISLESVIYGLFIYIGDLYALPIDLFPTTICLSGYFSFICLANAVIIKSSPNPM